MSEPGFYRKEVAALEKQIQRLEKTAQYHRRIIRKLKDGIMSYGSYRGLTAVRYQNKTVIQSLNEQQAGVSEGQSEKTKVQPFKGT